MCRTGRDMILTGITRLLRVLGLLICGWRVWEFEVGELMNCGVGGGEGREGLLCKMMCLLDSPGLIFR
jgi:hypothetical protein